MTRIEQSRLPLNRIPNRIESPGLSELANQVNKLLEDEKLNPAPTKPEEKPTGFNPIPLPKPTDLRALGDRIFAQLEEEEELENEEEKEDLENEEEEKEKAENAIKNVKKLKNAQANAIKNQTVTVDLSFDRASRGKTRYGS